MGKQLVRLLRKTLVSCLLLTVFCCGATTNTKITTNVTAKSWLVADEQGKIIEGVNTHDVRSIASITKLMTAMIVLDTSQSLDEIIPVKLYNKEQTRQTLIDLAIVKSDNLAAKLLCDFYPGGNSACISAMNRKAHDLGMTDTKFADPTGLNVMNVSTAEDLIKLVLSASKYEKIVEASNKSTMTVTNKKSKVVLYNTNPNVGRYSFLVSKTGFINRSGGCIVMMVATLNGIRTVVLLGSKNTKTRIPEANKLALAY